MNNIGIENQVEVYPNPFKDNVHISFVLDKNTDVSIEVYNILGMKVADLLNQKLSSGSHTTVWNSGKFDSGVYMVKVKKGGGEVVKRIVKVD